MIKECFYQTVGSDPFSNKPHSHENCYEIIQTLSSDGHIVVKDTIYPIKYGQLFLINAIDLHCSAPLNESEYMRNKLTLSSVSLDNLAKQINCYHIIKSLFIDNNCASVELNISEIERINSLFEEIINCNRKDSEPGNFGMYAKIFEMLQICYDKLSPQKPQYNTCTSQALAYINKHISEEISLSQMCSALYINKSYLCRRFKLATNMTIMEYIRARRISVSKKKLQFTDLSMTEIANLCGFRSSSQFSLFFKKATGLTPTKYKEKYRNSAL